MVKATVVSDGRFEIRERLLDHHRSLTARIRFLPSEVVQRFRARQWLSRPTRHSVQVGAAEHILLAPECLQFINHGCDPNVVFDTEAGAVVAIRTIEPGDEVLLFYPSTEWSLSSPFDCACGSPRCIGRVAGASALDPTVLRTHRLAPHVDRRLRVSTGAVTGSPA